MSLAHLLAARTEEDWQRAVTDVLTTLGYVWFHDRDARGNRAGFPDLAATNGHNLVLVELKAERGRVRPRQQVWADLLATSTHKITGIYRPSQAEQLWAELARKGD